MRVICRVRRLHPFLRFWVSAGTMGNRRGHLNGNDLGLFLGLTLVALRSVAIFARVEANDGLNLKLLLFGNLVEREGYELVHLGLALGVFCGTYSGACEGWSGAH